MPKWRAHTEASETITPTIGTKVKHGCSSPQLKEPHQSF